MKKGTAPSPTGTELRSSIVIVIVIAALTTPRTCLGLVASAQRWITRFSKPRLPSCGDGNLDFSYAQHLLAAACTSRSRSSLSSIIGRSRTMLHSSFSRLTRPSSGISLGSSPGYPREPWNAADLPPSVAMHFRATKSPALPFLVHQHRPSFPQSSLAKCPSQCCRLSH